MPPARRAGAQGRHQVRAQRLLGVGIPAQRATRRGPQPPDSCSGAPWRRAVRAPARLDREVINPLGGNVLGGPAFESEVAERVPGRATDRRSPASSRGRRLGYLHDWDNLRERLARRRSTSRTASRGRCTASRPGPRGRPLRRVARDRRRHRVSQGIAARAGQHRRRRHPQPAVGERPRLPVVAAVVSDPPDRATSSTRWFAASTTCPIVPVPAYTAVDARYAWRLLDGFELSIVARTSSTRRHAEFGAAPGRSEFERSFFVQARWTR